MGTALQLTDCAFNRVNRAEPEQDPRAEVLSECMFAVAAVAYAPWPPESFTSASPEGPALSVDLLRRVFETAGMRGLEVAASVGKLGRRRVFVEGFARDSGQS